VNPVIQILIEQYYRHRERLLHLAHQAQIAESDERALINAEIRSRRVDPQ
jgi:hypothetical protein